MSRRVLSVLSLAFVIALACAGGALAAPAAPATGPAPLAAGVGSASAGLDRIAPADGAARDRAAATGAVAHSSDRPGAPVGGKKSLATTSRGKTAPARPGAGAARAAAPGCLLRRSRPGPPGGGWLQTCRGRGAPRLLEGVRGQRFRLPLADRGVRAQKVVLGL